MPIEQYLQNPALRPTVLVQEVLKNVYRPSPREMPPASPDATENRIARGAPRAA
jgi:beta-lactamase class A